jgi:hypothetical protein
MSGPAMIGDTAKAFYNSVIESGMSGGCVSTLHLLMRGHSRTTGMNRDVSSNMVTSEQHLVVATWSEPQLLTLSHN